MRPTTALVALAALLAAGIARAEGGEACAADWTTVEYARVKASVVRVETANGAFGAGFFSLGMVGVFFGGSGSLELSYSLRVDVQRFASSTSQIAIGLWL